MLYNLHRSGFWKKTRQQSVLYNLHLVTSPLLLSTVSIQLRSFFGLTENVIMLILRFLSPSPCHIGDLVPRCEAFQCLSLPHTFRGEPLDRGVVEP